MDKSITGLTSFLGEVAATAISTDASCEIQPAIQRHLEAVGNVEHELGLSA